MFQIELRQIFMRKNKISETSYKQTHAVAVIRFIRELRVIEYRISILILVVTELTLSEL